MHFSLKVLELPDLGTSHLWLAELSKNLMLQKNFCLVWELMWFTVEKLEQGRYASHFLNNKKSVMEVFRTKKMFLYMLPFCYMVTIGWECFTNSFNTHILSYSYAPCLLMTKLLCHSGPPQLCYLILHTTCIKSLSILHVRLLHCFINHFLPGLNAGLKKASR